MLYPSCFEKSNKFNLRNDQVALKVFHFLFLSHLSEVQIMAYLNVLISNFACYSHWYHMNYLVVHFDFCFQKCYLPTF